MDGISKNDKGVIEIKTRLAEQGFCLEGVLSTYSPPRDEAFVRFDLVCPCGGNESINLSMSGDEFSRFRLGERFVEIGLPLIANFIAHIKEDVERGILPREWLGNA